MGQAEKGVVVHTWEELVSGPLLAMESSPPRLCEKRNDSSETTGSVEDR
jgi:hypothetical protein